MVGGGWWVVGGGWWVTPPDALYCYFGHPRRPQSACRLVATHPRTTHSSERLGERGPIPSGLVRLPSPPADCFCAQAQADFGPDGASASAGLFVADELHTLVQRDGRRRRLVRCRHVRYTRGLHIMRVFRLLDARSLAQVTSAGSAEAVSHCDAMGGGVRLRRRTKQRSCERLRELHALFSLEMRFLATTGNQLPRWVVGSEWFVMCGG